MNKLNVCTACQMTGPTEIDHIKTRGSGGPLEEFNEWALCRPCHRKKHDKGMAHMIKKYPHLEYRLKSKGWQIDLVLGKFKLWHPLLGGKL